MNNIYIIYINIVYKIETSVFYRNLSTDKRNLSPANEIGQRNQGKAMYLQF